MEGGQVVPGVSGTPNSAIPLPNVIVHITKSIGVNLYHKANISVGLKPELKPYCAISTIIPSVF